jgi:hypothetical protein
MPMYEDRAMLNKYSTLIREENPQMTRSDCMKIALKKLRNDKRKEFNHNKSMNKLCDKFAHMKI